MAASNFGSSPTQPGLLSQALGGSSSSPPSAVTPAAPPAAPAIPPAASGTPSPVFDARIAGNVVELLKKVKGIDGMEALAYAEAFAYVSQFVAAKPVGVPFAPGAKPA